MSKSPRVITIPFDPELEHCQVVSGSNETLPLAQGLGFRMSRLARTLRRTWAEELAGLGITPPQAAALRGIAQTPGCSLRSLARTLGTDPMSAKRCADELESLGLIRSERLPEDRRPRTLTITDSGLAVAGIVDVHVRHQEAQFNTQLSPGERTQFDITLTRLEEGLGIVGPPPAPQDGPTESGESPRSSHRAI